MYTHLLTAFEHHKKLQTLYLCNYVLYFIFLAKISFYDHKEFNILRRQCCRLCLHKVKVEETKNSFIHRYIQIYRHFFIGLFVNCILIDGYEKYWMLLVTVSLFRNDPSPRCYRFRVSIEVAPKS